MTDPASTGGRQPLVIVVGDVMLDVSVRAANLASGGDVRGPVAVRPGGAGANAAVWAAAGGARVRLHARVGRDLPGRLVQEAIHRWGVESSLTEDADARTGAMLVMRQAGERSMVADRAANARLSPDDLPPSLKASAVLVSAYLVFDAGSEAAAQAALDRADAEHVAVDAASWPLLEAYGAERFFDATRAATCLFLNAREAGVLTGRRGRDAAARLAGRYPSVFLKMGAGGALLARSGQVIQAAPSPVVEVDPTGAGDAFDGAVLAALSLGSEPGEALRAGCLAGARCASSPNLWPEPQSDEDSVPHPGALPLEAP